MIKTGENLRKSSLVARNNLMKSHTGIKQSSSEVSAVMWLNGNQASESACVWGLGRAQTAGAGLRGGLKDGSVWTA